MPTTKIASPFPKRFSDRQWSRYLKQGRDLVNEESDIQFRLGDLTLKMIPVQRPGAENQRGVFPVLDRYADEIGINVHTLITYRHVAVAWPAEHRASGVSWSIHKALDAMEDRFELIHNPPRGITRWTEDKALSHAGRLPRQPLTKAEKLDRVRVLLTQDENAAEAVTELIRRPDVAHQVMSNASNQRILYRAHHEQRLQAVGERLAAAHEEETEEAGAAEEAPQARRREPAVDYTRASSEVLELIGIGTSFLVEMQRLIPKLHVAEFTEREVRAVLDNHRRIRAALDWCDTVVSTGDKTMDEELARILGEGDE
ncbi:DUF6192 family protein [Streptomyces sp. NEAU-YJ-81]|uniref:DUF6192 family protein n=1 Tax=Streptomyces sp. NEAU-YJ-81 TaxID=2820288 RepID=UPI001ABD3D9B|nr:DUF6192 family protein [Streptomyces sp. NEAU-YJ-81]MBO3682836.1 hypothetical protein [Streptomyces sp. NEAU-YJ-81]